MSDIKILWADDEIDLLKPQIMFLEKKGYDVTTVTNGHDAIEKCKEDKPEVVFLDESMPGLTGLETLTHIKEIDNNLPIVMITKNEEENLMEDAIGSQITDYLIKPVNPNQILMSLKKILDSKEIRSEKTNSLYQQEFQKIFMEVQNVNTHEEWAELYKRLIYWELELDKNNATAMSEVFSMQKSEANSEFTKFVMKNYLEWLNGNTDVPTLSHTLFKNKIFPKLKNDVTNFVVVIDNLRYDQWRILQPIFNEYFKINTEEHFYSILPTCTQYSRNAIFSGLMPSEISRRYRDKWLNDDEEGGKNMHEEFFLQEQIRLSNRDYKLSYSKITNHHNGKNLVDNMTNLLNNDLNVIVYNFVDMLSHARTEMEVLKELASDEAAYRSLTVSWFEHSPLLEALRKIADKPVNLIVTTDHGTVRVKKPSKIIGDKNTTTNLRYKNGKNLNFNKKDVFEVKEPLEAGLPKSNLSSSYVFAKDDLYFVYPNNYNYYANYFRNTFQHGGISLEEVIVPCIHLTNK